MANQMCSQLTYQERIITTTKKEISPSQKGKKKKLKQQTTIHIETKKDKTLADPAASGALKLSPRTLILGCDMQDLAKPKQTLHDQRCTQSVSCAKEWAFDSSPTQVPVQQPSPKSCVPAGD